MGMALEQRRERIIEFIRQQGHVRHSELAARFSVSVVTIRHDVDALQSEGLLQKTYGGAVVASPNVDSEFAERARLYRAEKQRIGAAAAGAIRQGETVILDAGTTTIEIARRLPEHAGVTVVTCALNIALEAATHPGVTVLACGGIVNPRTLQATGHWPEKMLAEMNADRLFLATYGADLAKGLTDRNLTTAPVKRALLAAAREVILVCDSSKFGHVASTSVAPLNVVHRVVTDRGIPPAFLDHFAARGIPVETV